MKTGDKVKVLRPEIWGGKKHGTIVVIDTDTGAYGIDFGEDVGGHSLYLDDKDYCRDNYGWWLNECEFVKAPPLHICTLVCACNAKEAITFEG